MAIRHLTVKVGKIGKAAAHAAYIGRSGKYARQPDDDLVATGSGNMPSWAIDNPADFWAAADEHERANGTTYREIQVALPRELGSEAALQLAQEFIGRHLGVRYPHTYAIHCPLAADGQPQPHMHLMFSERALDGFERARAVFFKRANKRTPQVGGATKAYNPAATPTTRRAALKALRAEWAELATQALTAAGFAIRIDLRSNEAQGLEQAPEPKHSPAGWRKGGREAMVAARGRVVTADAAVFAAYEAQDEAIARRIEVRARLAVEAQQEKAAMAAQEVFRATRERQRLAADAAAQEKAAQAAQEIVRATRERRRLAADAAAQEKAAKAAQEVIRATQERQRQAVNAAAEEKAAQIAASRVLVTPAKPIQPNPMASLARTFAEAQDAKAKQEARELVAAAAALEEAELELTREIGLAQAEFDDLLLLHPKLRNPTDRRMLLLPVVRDDLLDPPVTHRRLAITHFLTRDSRSRVLADWGDRRSGKLSVHPEQFRAALEHMPDVGTLREVMDAFRELVLATVALLSRGGRSLQSGKDPNGGRER